jgi:hypothetical protein
MATITKHSKEETIKLRPIVKDFLNDLDTLELGESITIDYTDDPKLQTQKSYPLNIQRKVYEKGNEFGKKFTTKKVGNTLFVECTGSKPKKPKKK